MRSNVSEVKYNRIPPSPTIWRRRTISRDITWESFPKEDGRRVGAKGEIPQESTGITIISISMRNTNKPKK
jgi:hypothetical protein